MNKNFTQKPKLTVQLDPELFKNYYWYKKELVSFCSKNGLSTYGGKLDLIDRIEHFLRTGQATSFTAIRRIGKWDSDTTITKETPVINYKNDAKTRNFFKKEIGSHFHFNEYLRKFAKNCNKKHKLSYGDLVKGWIKAEQQKKNLPYKSKIGKQFEFNQFQRDFYAKEKGKTRKELIEAWRLVRFRSGPNTYAYYLEIIKKSN